MTSLRDQIIALIAALRAQRVRISVAESIDAMRAVAAAGFGRDSMREALAAALVKDEADRPAFDEAFMRFFAAPPSGPIRGAHPKHRGQLDSAAGGRGRPGEHPSQTTTPRGKPQPARAGTKSAPRDQHARGDSGGRERTDEETRPRGGDVQSQESSAQAPPAENRGAAEIGIEAGRAARIRTIERTPFAAYTELEYEQARDALAILKRRFRARLGRRLKIAAAGRIDFRRTIRAATQHGGVLTDLRFRARRPRHIDLTILADISGSVRYAAELMLELIAGARENFHRVRSFVYIDRLAEAGFEGRHLITETALDPFGRSDFGRVLGEAWDRRAELFGRQTVVVILGDGRNNRRPARADLLREIARHCRAVLWLNPEDPARWGTGDSAIAQYTKEVRAHVAAGNLRELERGLLEVA